jgi:hypothetical protein
MSLDLCCIYTYNVSAQLRIASWVDVYPAQHQSLALTSLPTSEFAYRSLKLLCNVHGFQSEFAVVERITGTAHKLYV